MNQFCSRRKNRIFSSLAIWHSFLSYSGSILVPFLSYSCHVYCSFFQFIDYQDHRKRCHERTKLSIINQPLLSLFLSLMACIKSETVSISGQIRTSQFEPWDGQELNEDQLVPTWDRQELNEDHFIPTWELDEKWSDIWCIQFEQLTSGSETTSFHHISSTHRVLDLKPHLFNTSCLHIHDVCGEI